MGQLFCLPSQRNIPISFKPKVAIASSLGKCNKKSGIVKSGLDAMPLFLLYNLLRDIFLLAHRVKNHLFFLSFTEAFATNPQFFINLNDPDPYDDITKCPVIISLMQRQKTRKSEHAIGFKIFKCDLSTKRLTANDIRTNRSVITHFFKHIF